MISAGHEWDNIRKYNFYELGIFNRACARKNKVDQKNRVLERLLFNWFSSNLDYKKLNKLISKIENGMLTGDDDRRPSDTGQNKEESEQLKNIRRVVNVMRKL